VARIEAETLLAAPPPVVWSVLIDHQGWPSWARWPAPEASEAPRGPEDEAGPETEAGPEARAGGESGEPGEPAALAGGLRLERVDVLAGPPDRVGAVRRCTASVGPLPWLGTRTFGWTDRLVDVHAPWLMELDVAAAPRPFRQARLRLVVLEDAPGRSRLRLRLTYAPGLLWPVDVLFLRPALATGLRRALDGLAASWDARPASETAAPADETPSSRAA
jgi:hypothetical protein